MTTPSEKRTPPWLDTNEDGEYIMSAEYRMAEELREMREELKEIRHTLNSIAGATWKIAEARAK